MGKGGAQEESRLIKHYADQWCKDNGYPVQQRKICANKERDCYQRPVKGVDTQI